MRHQSASMADLLGRLGLANRGAAQEARSRRLSGDLPSAQSHDPQIEAQHQKLPSQGVAPEDVRTLRDIAATPHRQDEGPGMP